MDDATGKEIIPQDYTVSGKVGIQIGRTGRKLWVCIDGICVLRISTSEIRVLDMRKANVS